MVACSYKEDPSKPFKLGIIPSAGGQPAKTFDFLPKAHPGAGLEWTADGQAITYARTGSGSETLWEQPVDGGPPKQVTGFKTDRILSFKWSRDGKQLAVVHGTEISDVVLISDFR
jgi:hypothetical protein